MRKTARTAVAIMFKAEDVFAAACAAQRINGVYLKDAQTEMDPVTYETISVKQPNKVIMRQMLTEHAELITDVDRYNAQVVRNYFQCKLIEVLSNTANDFIRNAVDLASREEFASNDWLGLATVACLPQSYERGLKRDERNEIKSDAIAVSKHFGKVGDRVAGECEIIDARYSQNWDTWYINAKHGTDVILFAYKKELEVGKTYQFSGTVKGHRDDSVTQLNRVKIK